MLSSLFLKAFSKKKGIWRTMKKMLSRLFLKAFVKPKDIWRTMKKMLSSFFLKAVSKNKSYSADLVFGVVVFGLATSRILLLFCYCSP